MPAGRYRQLVTIQRLKGTPTDADPLGPVNLETAGNWETYSTLYVWQIPRTARRNRETEADAALSELSYRFRTRHSTAAAAISPEDRLVLADGTTLHIVSVQPVNDRRRELEITATENA